MVFLTEDGDEPLISFPLALPMGWENSPPYFTTATEKISDLANARLKEQTFVAPHALDSISETPVPQEVALPHKVESQPHYVALTEANNVPVADQAHRWVAKHDVFVSIF